MNCFPFVYCKHCGLVVIIQWMLNGTCSCGAEYSWRNGQEIINSKETSDDQEK